MYLHVLTFFTTSFKLLNQVENEWKNTTHYFIFFCRAIVWKCNSIDLNTKKYRIKKNEFLKRSK